MNIKGVDTSSINSASSARIIDNEIDRITEMVVKKASFGSTFGIRTACFMDGEFVCVSDYDLNEEQYLKLKDKAYNIQDVKTKKAIIKKVVNLASEILIESGEEVTEENMTSVLKFVLEKGTEILSDKNALKEFII